MNTLSIISSSHYLADPAFCDGALIHYYIEEYGDHRRWGAENKELNICVSAGTKEEARGCFERCYETYLVLKDIKDKQTQNSPMSKLESLKSEVVNSLNTTQQIAALAAKIEELESKVKSLEEKVLTKKDDVFGLFCESVMGKS